MRGRFVKACGDVFKDTLSAVFPELGKDEGYGAAERFVKLRDAIGVIIGAMEWCFVPAGDGKVAERWSAVFPSEIALRAEVVSSELKL